MDTRVHFGLRSPAQVVNWCPCLASATADGIPNCTVIAKIICKCHAATRLVDDGDGPVSIKVAVVDYLPAAGEGAEGWGAGDRWGLGVSERKK